MDLYSSVVLISIIVCVQGLPSAFEVGKVEAKCKFDEAFPAFGLERPQGHIKFSQPLQYGFTSQMSGPTFIEIQLEGFNRYDMDIGHTLQINDSPVGFGNIARSGCSPASKPFNPHGAAGLAAKSIHGPGAGAGTGVGNGPLPSGSPSAAAASPGRPLTAGDLGRIVEDIEGNARGMLMSRGISLLGPKSIIGKTVSIMDKGAPGQTPIVLGCCFVAPDTESIIPYAMYATPTVAVAHAPSAAVAHAPAAAVAHLPAAAVAHLPAAAVAHTPAAALAHAAFGFDIEEGNEFLNSMMLQRKINAATGDTGQQLPLGLFADADDLAKILYHQRLLRG